VKRKPVKVVLLVALVSVAGLAAFGPAGIPVADSSVGRVFDVQVGSPAVLTARGAAVKVPINAVCIGVRQAFVSVQVTERVGSRIAQGTTGTTIKCTAGIQPLVVSVPATANAFKKGTAQVNAQIGFCDFCGGETSTSAEVRVVRK
jgi:hypothetical protein